jgi:hypothetical protein
MGADNFPNLSAQETVIAHRRELVARARLRGASIREIVVAMAAMGFVNPVTDEPWSKSIVHQDIQALESEWQDSARSAIEEHKANQLAELREWHDNDMSSVLSAIRLEMALMGSESPKVTQVVGKNGGPVQIENVKGYVNVSPDGWDQNKANSDL